MLCPRVEEGNRPRPRLFLHLVADFVGGVSLPVNGIAVPLNHLITKAPGGLHQQVVVGARRGSEQLGPGPGDLLHLIRCILNLFHNSRPVQFGHILMPVRVVANLVARIPNGFDRFGVFVTPLPHHKKSGLYTSLIQNIQQLRDVGVVPSTVDPQRDGLSLPLHRVDRQLPFGCGRCLYAPEKVSS